MHHSHDIDVPKLRSAFAPVGVGHAEMATNLSARLHLAASGDGPVKKSVEAGDSLAAGGWLDVLEKGGKAPDHFLLVESLGDFTKAI